MTSQAIVLAAIFNETRPKFKIEINDSFCPSRLGIN